MERVEHRDGVLQLVVDGASVAVEWVQGGDRDAFPERVAAVTKPGLVSLTGAARDQIEESGPDASVLVAGEMIRFEDDLGPALSTDVELAVAGRNLVDRLALAPLDS